MTSSINNRGIAYAPKTIKRAQRALSCSPFCLKLFRDMQNQSVPIQSIAGEIGIKSGYANQAFNESKTEAKLVWLINVGLLRREVDGQGLTDSFRLTPLGRNIVSQWEQMENQIPPASIVDRVYNLFSQWLK